VSEALFSNREDAKVAKKNALRETSGFPSPLRRETQHGPTPRSEDGCYVGSGSARGMNPGDLRPGWRRRSVSSRRLPAMVRSFSAARKSEALGWPRFRGQVV